jgi:rhamnogalacturonan endolyase
MENLGRGVVALNMGGGKVFVSWRLLGTDPEEIAFNLYRATGEEKPVKLNTAPITDATNYTDTGVDTAKSNTYFVRPILKGVEQAMSKSFLNKLPANAPVRQYVEVPMKTPAGYTINDCSVGDLDGDGEYEIVVHMTGRGKDNSQNGPTDPPILQAYKFDGT